MYISYIHMDVCIRMYPIVSVQSYNTPSVCTIHTEYSKASFVPPVQISYHCTFATMVSVRQSISPTTHVERTRRAASQSTLYGYYALHYPYGRHQRGHNQLILINSRQNYLPKDVVLKKKKKICLSGPQTGFCFCIF